MRSGFLFYDMFVVEVIGTMVFAISGALTAANKRFDFVGVSVIAFVTALGGGTIRDVLIGSLPVGWMQSKWYALAVFCGVVLAYVFYKKLQILRKSLFLFDAIGLGVFAIGGFQKALAAGIDPVYAIICGMITGTFGGLLRDVLCNDVPLIFRKEIYASAALVGVVVFFLFQNVFLLPVVGFIIAVSLVIGIRILAVKFNLGLPKIKID
ncbi:trimeric intracellular cation channel family protein [Paracrocinitomix mangrovi]|uniref:trimeric intracellular cation channel family protein n=1 Tax=Paracrocinitomix mangrovi TaxID=2862509 RepID=UPI001ED9EA49|nr:trimeric intracellular cation channel family protein [Paracrocinitomix mangrovi]UKN00361.1 trimeric intracellular cation channel family protein [Paracrocinitomix mangrovi]